MRELKSQKWTGEFLFLCSSSVWDHTSSRVSDTRISAAAFAEFRQAVQDRLDRGAVFKPSFFGRASWCSNISHQLLVWWGDHRLFYFHVPPLYGVPRGLRVSMDWDLDTPGYGGGSGYSSAAQAWERHGTVPTLDLLELTRLASSSIVEDFVPDYLWAFLNRLPEYDWSHHWLASREEIFAHLHTWGLMHRGLWRDPGTFLAPASDAVVGNGATPCQLRSAHIGRSVDGLAPKSMSHWVMADLRTQSHCRQHVAFVETPAKGPADAGSVCFGSAVQPWNPVLAASRWILTAVSALAAMAYRDQVQHLVEAAGDGPSSSSASAPGMEHLLPVGAIWRIIGWRFDSSRRTISFLQLRQYSNGMCPDHIFSATIAQAKA